MRYPAKYTGSCRTLCPDGDRWMRFSCTCAGSPFYPGLRGAFAPDRPLLNLEDEHGGDGKADLRAGRHHLPLLFGCGPEDQRTCPLFIFQQIEHFFTHYEGPRKREVGPDRQVGGAMPQRRRQVTIEAIGDGV